MKSFNIIRYLKKWWPLIALMSFCAGVFFERVHVFAVFVRTAEQRDIVDDRLRQIAARAEFIEAC